MNNWALDDNLCMHSMIWICTFYACLKALFHLTWPILCITPILVLRQKQTYQIHRINFAGVTGTAYCDPPIFQEISNGIWNDEVQFKIDIWNDFHKCLKIQNTLFHTFYLSFAFYATLSQNTQWNSKQVIWMMERQTGYMNDGKANRVYEWWKGKQGIWTLEKWGSACWLLS